MRFTPWATRLALTLSLSATALLTACGGSGSSSSAQVRLINATRSYPQLDLTANDKTVGSKVGYAAASDYSSVDTNAPTIRVQTSDTGTSISALSPNLTGGNNYTIITFGFAGAISSRLLEENVDAADANKAKLLIYNLAPDAGALDAYLTTAADCSLATETPLTSNLSGGTNSGYIVVNSGTFRICVTGYGRRTDLRLNIPAVTLDSTSVNTLILTASDGGVLVNGVTFVQKGAVKNFPNSQARVRTVAALANGGTVTSSINNQSMFSGAISPLISDYVTTSSGASTLTVQVNGVDKTFPAPTLTAGHDYTMLVWGDPASPKLAPLDDDNRLPTGAAGTADVKIRVVNALSTSGVGLNVGFGAIASNVAAGTAAPSNTTGSSASTQVDMTIPTQALSIYTNSTLALPTGSVWTFFAVPNTATTATTNSPVPGMTALPKRERP
ncbi:DUF4397 domain-containing protein [Pelomonas cellulosilytica]|uniref:DUF4397 domain-containing protein n=1 Tax=Pelomonas cellulosilytica TaxID=2906762 RepID=A0ABS8XLJ2_9BURK|nr:DUF4397 domain-containing protein [Pelomonas sp. P8]MCE4553676.1 DUF4397 domain-containing protein [Pelomonas sp. P8]